jgi:hypothetical protein
MNEAIKAINDRIDWLKAKYRDCEGEERLYFKARLNEAITVRDMVITYSQQNTIKG